MRLRATILEFLLFSCVFCCVGGVAHADTRLASTAYVDSTIERSGAGAVEIKNTAGSPVTLSQNPQTSAAVNTSSNVVATVGWTDTNRTSKVRSGSASSTTLVDMWIE